MAETDAQTVVTPTAPAKQGEPCEECAAPLAADQRYCLNCGRRHGSARVDYRHYMRGVAQPPVQPGEAPAEEPAQSAGAEEPAKTQRDYAPLAAVGGIAVLGLMLLVGVLIGKGNSDTASTPPQQVIRVPVTSGEANGSQGEGSSQNTGGGLGGGGAAKQAKQSTAGGNSGGTGSAVKASEGDLESLSSESGADYEQKSKELPNEIATPGAPPPIDKSTAPGGGEGGAEVIK